MSSLRDAALQLTGVLESLGIAYAIGGSFASSVHGIARPTQDLDVIAAILPGHVPALVAALDKAFYVDSEMMRQALRERRAFNVIHFKTGLKVDVFPVDSHLLGAEQIRRCRPAQSSILGGAPASFPVISAEDTILVKLRWYRDGGESSERQWNDLRNILKIQSALDLEYLTGWAGKLEVSDLLTRLMDENTKQGGAPDDHA